jgi:5-aminolevulinate synthase
MADKYNALTYLDEVHAVGMYGARGGISEGRGRAPARHHRGHAGQGVRRDGRLYRGRPDDHRRDPLYAPGFIFTTSLSPVLVAGVLASVRHLKQSAVEREGQQAAAARLKAMMRDAGLPVMLGETHIVPVMVGDPVRPRRSATSCSPNMACTSSRSIIPRCRAAPNACASRRAGA